MKKIVIIAIAGILTCPGLSLAQGKGGDLPVPNATNLNSSRSNNYRQQSDPAQPPTAGTTVKGSESNTSERYMKIEDTDKGRKAADQPGGEPKPAINLNSSKSN